MFIVLLVALLLGGNLKTTAPVVTPQGGKTTSGTSSSDIQYEKEKSWPFYDLSDATVDASCREVRVAAYRVATALTDPNLTLTSVRSGCYGGSNEVGHSFDVTMDYNLTGQDKTDFKTVAKNVSAKIDPVINKSDMQAVNEYSVWTSSPKGTTGRSVSVDVRIKPGIFLSKYPTGEPLQTRNYTKD